MQITSIFAFLTTSVAVCAAQAHHDIGVRPDEPSPAGCVDTYDGQLSLLVGPVKDTTLATKVQLQDGVLTDSAGRIGAIVANWQFQFDGPPPQAGSIYTGGFSRCENGSLAIGATTVFWRCNSGEFDNWYGKKIAEYCQASNVLLKPENEKSSSSSSSVAPSTSSSSSDSTSTSASASSTASVSSSVSGTISASPSRNATISSPTPSRSLSASITSVPAPATSGGGTAASTSSTGAAILATRLPRPETFGAVVGIIGAALML